MTLILSESWISLSVFGSLCVKDDEEERPREDDEIREHESVESSSFNFLCVCVFFLQVRKKRFYEFDNV